MTCNETVCIAKSETRAEEEAMANLWTGFRRTPRWVQVFTVVGLILLAVLIVALLGGHGGPARHGAGH
jgi:hypothetical protein